MKASLLSGEGGAAVEAFLKDLGVKPLRPEEFILNWLLPQYPKVASVAVDLNLQHIRYLLGAIDRVPAGEKRKVCEAISITPLLQARKQSSGTAIALVAPNRAYLPCLFTGNDDLEVFFAATPEAYFVLSGYKLATDEIKKWQEFLLEIKCSELPRRLPKPNAGYNTEDWLIHGLEAAFAGLVGLDFSLAQKTAEATWRLLVRLLPGPEWDRKRHLQGRREIYGPRGGHLGSQSFDAAFVEQLKQNSWLPGQDGKLHKPSELFADKADNRQLLGDSVAYVTNSVLLDTEPAQWLANTLNLNLAPNAEHVLHHLRLLSGKVVAPETPSTIYAFLARQSVQVRDVFQRERLIFTTSPCPLWCSSGAVFWEDESAVFGEQRGYLSSQYPESLKPFFSSVGVAERASSLDYVRAIRELAKSGVVSEEIQLRVHNLYRRVWAVNRAGMKRVMEYEKEKAGRCPEEMSHTHPGYDVESKNQAGHIERYIEVKSCPSVWDGRGVAMSKTQFEKAVELGENFWLYIVERAEQEDFNIVRIQNPARLVNQFFYDDGWREVGE